MSSFTYKRKWIQIRDQVNRPLVINPFVFTKSFFIWTFLGVAGGVIAGLYWKCIDYLMKVTKHLDLGWEVIAIMGLSGLVIGIIIYHTGDPGKLEVVLNNIRFKGGHLDTKHNPSMIVTSMIGISAGSSAGPESPMVQVIGSLGSWISHKLKLSREDHRSMTIAGMASGFTAMFGIPLAGSLFALEIIHHKHVVHYYAALIPAFVSSGTTYIVFQWITKMGVSPVWKLPFPESVNKLDDVFYAMIYGVIAAAAGWLIIWLFRSLKRLFKTINLPFYIQTFIAGIILGVLAWKFPITRYFSHYEIIDLLHGTWSLNLLIAFFFVKTFSMVLTVTSGWRGGYIIPLMFIGVALGMIISNVFPNQNMALAVVCCMAAVNACVTRTPISSVILVGSLTDFTFFIPILFASLTGFFLAPKSPLIAAQLGKEKKLLDESLSR